MPCPQNQTGLALLQQQKKLLKETNRALLEANFALSNFQHQNGCVESSAKNHLDEDSPGSPKTKLCPLVVGNRLHGSS